MERCQLDIALEYDQNGYKALASKDGREPKDDLKKRPRRVNVLVACPPGPEQPLSQLDFAQGGTCAGPRESAISSCCTGSRNRFPHADASRRKSLTDASIPISLFAFLCLGHSNNIT
jgi:hypothetical protein